MIKDFELIPHTADLQLRVYGHSLKQLFQHAVMGMFQSIGPKAPACKVVHDRLVCNQLPMHHDVACDAPDIESLLVTFLSQALYLSDIHNEAYLDALIHEVSDKSVRATLLGVSITGFEVVEIKAVTYHNLAVKQRDGQWQADIVFDI